jgi:hypothetical protein
MKAIFAFAALVFTTAAIADPGNNPPSQRSPFPAAAGRIARAAGDRFTKPGKERLQGTAEVRVNGNASRTLRFVLQFPRRLRIEGDGVKATFRPDKQWSGQLPEDVQQLAETLLFDSVDGFLASQFLGGATRHNGSGYADPASGQAFDIFTVSTIRPTRSGLREVPAQFWFDSSRGLLVRVVRLGSEVVYSDWREFDGNWVPMTVARRVAGDTTVQVNFAPPGFASAQDDGLFN